NEVYEALMDSHRHGEFTGGGPTEVSPEPGGTFSAFGGAIAGRNVELVPNERIVQAWRVADWPAGAHSLVRFELQEQGGKTRLVMDHSAFPEEQQEHLAAGWNTRYWEPLGKYLSR